jgi:hypothetical protein
MPCLLAIDINPGAMGNLATVLRTFIDRIGNFGIVEIVDRRR